MRHVKLTLALWIFSALFVGVPGWAEESIPEAPAAEAPRAAPQAPAPVAVAPYRTFITVQRYTMENNGDPGNAISNVRLEMKFPGDIQIKLPGGEQYWPIGNGQVQEVNQTFEIPWAFIRNDGFSFVIQMVRKGARFLPCQFEVRELSQFNRTYTCQTDVNWQVNNRVPPEQVNREAVHIRIFTDRNSPAREIPKDAIALK